MRVNKLNYRILNNLDDVYYRCIKDVNKELKEKGCRVPAFGNMISIKRFKRIVKQYVLNLMNRVIYNHESVEFFSSLGFLNAHKILCTRFNPYGIDVSKTDGYYYFTFWVSPKRYCHCKFKAASSFKKAIFNNIRYNNSDYPEIYPNTYTQYENLKK